MTRTPILIATAGDSQERLQRVLRGHDVTLAAGFEEAIARLMTREFALVVLGTHFAESSVFEVLERLPRERRSRVVCVQGLPFSHGLGRSTFAAFSSACLALGAGRVLDLTQFVEDPAGDAQVRELLEGELLSASFSPRPSPSSSPA